MADHKGQRRRLVTVAGGEVRSLLLLVVGKLGQVDPPALDLEIRRRRLAAEALRGLRLVRSLARRHAPLTAAAAVEPPLLLVAWQRNVEGPVELEALFRELPRSFTTWWLQGRELGQVDEVRSLAKARFRLVAHSQIVSSDRLLLPGVPEVEVER